MVGLERSILPELAKTEFDLAVKNSLTVFHRGFLESPKRLAITLQEPLPIRLGARTFWSLVGFLPCPFPIILMHARRGTGSLAPMCYSELIKD